MKKICHLTTVHPAFDVRIFQKEIKTLSSASFDVILIAQHDKNDMINGIKIVALPKAMNRIHRMIIITFKAFWIALKQKADVYHIHDPELLPLGVLLKLIKGKRVIYDAHEDYCKQTLSKPYLSKQSRRVIAFLVRMIEYFSSKLFDAIITATDDILKNFPRHRNAISLKNFPLLSSFSIIEEKNKEKNDIFRLIYNGGLAEIRGVTQIIRALELIDSKDILRLTLCGKFSPKPYEIEVRALEGFKKVEYLGWVESNHVPNLLRMHDAGIVCLHPIANYLTSLPLKLFEYMAAGLPVIASNFPLWKEIVEGNGCGICVDPLKPEEIAKAITYLMDRPGLRKDMGEKGRQAVQEKYNWESEGQKIVELYRNLLA